MADTPLIQFDVDGQEPNSALEASGKQTQLSESDSNPSISPFGSQSFNSHLSSSAAADATSATSNDHLSQAAPTATAAESDALAHTHSAPPTKPGDTIDATTAGAAHDEGESLITAAQVLNAEHTTTSAAPTHAPSAATDVRDIAEPVPLSETPEPSAEYSMFNMSSHDWDLSAMQLDATHKTAPSSQLHSIISASSAGLEDQTLSDTEDLPLRQASVTSSIGQAPPSGQLLSVLEGATRSRSQLGLTGLGGTAGSSSPMRVSSVRVANDKVERVSQLSATEELLPELFATEVPLRVVVSDPERHDATKLGMKSSHISYLIRTSTSLPSFASDGHVEVRRKQADLEALAKVLRGSFKGYFAPPLPDKAVVESRFLEESALRMRVLDVQVYMRMLAGHPVLRGSEELRLFLTVSGDLAVNPPWQALLHRHSRLDTVLRGMVSSMFKGLGPASNAAVQEDLPEEEVHLRQAREWLQSISSVLEQSSAALRKMVFDLEQLCEDFGVLSSSLHALARWETHMSERSQHTGQYREADVSRTVTSEVAALDALASSSGEHHTSVRQHALRLASCAALLHSHAMLMPEGVEVLQEREQVLVTVQALERELRDKQQQLGKLSDPAVPASNSMAAMLRDRQLSGLQQSVGTLEEQLKQAREHYSMLRDRNQAELARLRLERAADLRSFVAAFVQAQLQLSSAAADLWTNAIHPPSPGASK